MRTKHEILIIDDEPATLFAFTEYLSDVGFSVKKASCLADARASLSSQQFDAVLLDVRLPDGSGIDFISELKEKYPLTAIIVITGIGNVPLAVDAMRRGADNFLTKPVTLSDLEVFLRKSLEVGSLRKKDLTHKRLARKEEPYWGESVAMKGVLELAGIAAQSSSPVLIAGETGTGKGVMARWIHEQSALSSAAFIDVNCSVLKGDLLASELFGHVKGAFTSAIQDKQGLIEIANNGTLFLDEIGDMDPGVQAQLLKVIEEKQFRRLGDTAVRKSDFRLICATNRDLEQNAQGNRFRKDLYFRINVLHIAIPPLRERKEDIPGLALHMLKSLGSPHPDMPAEVIAALSQYPWPGNCRELRNILERALLLSRGAPLAPAHFAGLRPDAGKSGSGFKNLEKDYLLKALDQASGDAKRAAESLGIPLSTFYRKTKKYRPAP